MNIGDRIGDYEITGILGAGGMGQVYQVRNVLSDRIEAMKVLLPSLEGDADLADRFLREIKLQATLDHPNIAKLHTAQRVSNQLLMFMEFVDGTSIEKLLSKGPLPVGDAVTYASQVLDALAYAHARGVVHRDIKPANIMRTAAGAVKLMDFGIARMKADRRLTQTGTTVGSLHYMSPEQIQGAQPDPRSDLYSLGVTVYEMITGQLPFKGESDYSIMSAHLQQTPAPPIQLAPAMPGSLNDIILMAIARDPAARFQTAEAFRAALHAVIGPGAPTRPMTAPGPPPLPAPAPLPVPAKTSNRRALYMTAGSLATLAVLALGVIEIPKFRRAGASVNPALQDVPAPAPFPSPQDSPASVTPAPSEPQPSSTAAAGGSQSTAPGRVRQSQPPVSHPSAAQPVEPGLAGPSQNPAPKSPAPPADSAPLPAPQMNELREQYNLLAVRASTAKSGLRSLQQQMSSQGLGLRADVREAETRMDYLMNEAMSSLRSGHPEGAKRNLQMAERTLETIEKFLSR